MRINDHISAGEDEIIQKELGRKALDVQAVSGRGAWFMGYGQPKIYFQPAAEIARIVDQLGFDPHGQAELFKAIALINIQSQVIFAVEAKPGHWKVVTAIIY